MYALQRQEEKESVAAVPPPPPPPHQSTSENQIPIETLKTLGISDSHITILKSAGYNTVQSIAYTLKKVLLKINGLSDQAINQIQTAAYQLVDIGFTTATKILAKRSNIIKLTTGSKWLDNLLGGGIESSSITELAGESCSGKTQLALTLAVTCQMPLDVGGCEGKCIFIDTMGTFRSERILEIADRFEMNNLLVLDNIMYARVYNSDHQLSLLFQATTIMFETKISLLIVDSPTSTYRSEYDGRKELYNRQQHLGKLLRILQRLADEFQVVIVITNQVRADMTSTFAHFSSEDSRQQPIGGNILAHTSTTRLQLRRGPGNKRFFKVINSPILPEKEVFCHITSGGISDQDLST